MQNVYWQQPHLKWPNLYELKPSRSIVNFFYKSAPAALSGNEIRSEEFCSLYKVQTQCPNQLDLVEWRVELGKREHPTKAVTLTEANISPMHWMNNQGYNHFPIRRCFLATTFSMSICGADKLSDLLKLPFPKQAISTLEADCSLAFAYRYSHYQRRPAK